MTSFVVALGIVLTVYALRITPQQVRRVVRRHRFRVVLHRRNREVRQNPDDPPPIPALFGGPASTLRRGI